MLRVLLETRARRPRRAGGMVLSVVTHLAIVGALTATAVHGKPVRHKPERAVVIRFKAPRAPTPVQQRAQSGGGSPVPSTPPISIDRIPIPNIETSLPPIDLERKPSFDPSTIAIGGPSGPSVPRGLFSGGDSAAAEPEWRGNELIMRIVKSATPRYPETLRQTGVDGRVIVRFMIDTTGRINDASVQVVSSTHDLFSRSVRDVLGNFRFKPAEVGGRRVAALAEMPFEFRITR